MWVAHHMTELEPDLEVVHFLKLWSACQCCLFFPHHHPLMNFYHISLLLLVVLSAYSGSPQHAKPLDSPNPIRVINSTSSSTQLGVLAPGLPQNEVFRIVLPQNGVFFLPQNEMFTSTLPPNGVLKTVQLQNEVFKPVTAHCQMFCNLKISPDFALGLCYLVWKN